METLKAGSPAYIDSFMGLICCMVQTIEGTSGLANSSQLVTAKVTSRSYHGYPKGSIVEFSALRIVPRKAVTKGKYQTRIKGYMVECDKKGSR
jgi:hypothetical protein